MIEKLVDSKNKIILIWGYGVTGQSLLRFCQNFLHNSNQYIVLDKKYIQKKEEANVCYVCDAEKNFYFNMADFILPSPGIKLNNEDQYFKKIICEFDIFFYLNRVMQYTVALVTGSIGKTSTVTLLGHYLKEAFDEVIIGGNIGIPLLDCLNYQHTKKLIVIEASSVQLEHATMVNADYVVITNLYENHLDMHTSFYAYGRAKLNSIFQNKNLKKCFLHESVMNFIVSNKIDIENFKEQTIVYDSSSKELQSMVVKKDGAFYYDQKIFLLEKDIPQFSYINNWIVVALMKFLIRDKIVYFDQYETPQLPHFRLEKIYDNANIVIYNDSKATVLESTLAAIDTLSTREEASLIYVIIGGLSKGVDRQKNFAHIVNKVAKVFVFGAEKLDFCGDFVFQRESLEDIVQEFYEEVTLTKRVYNKKIILLFSPGGSSFDLYQSYIDRGESFNHLVEKCFSLSSSDNNLDLLKNNGRVMQ